MATWRVALAIALLLLAGGCGGGAAPDDIRSAWEAASHAVAAGDATGFCTMVTVEGRRMIGRMTKLSCEDAVRLLSSRLNPADKSAIRAARITEIEVDGDAATVTYEVSAALAKVGFTGHTAMSRVGGHWLLRGV